MECAICCEKYTGTKANLVTWVTCPTCAVEVCEGCIKQFLVSRAGIIGESGAACMACRAPWARAFLVRTIRPTVMWGALRKHREDVLFEAEKALLPATAAVLGVMQQLKELQEEKAEEEDKGSIKELTTRIGDLKHQKEVMIAHMEGREVPVRKGKKRGAVEEVPRVFCPCPAVDCRGFIFERKYECDACHTRVCKTCQVSIGDGLGVSHVCKEEDVATMKLIKSQCKACPGCGVLSRKTEGCSQVWCMMCHKAWNWETGKLVTGGYIHATDYLNYLRSNGQQVPRAPQDDPWAADEVP
jgi:hypothetical protein